MGDLNQFDFVVENLSLIKGPVLEIGSKDYGNTNNFRPYFSQDVFIGIDQDAGTGVDKVCDFTENYTSLKQQIGIDKFGLIICLSVLEHCRNPFKMAENISQFLEEEGYLFISVPFVWNLHSFPEDYWRFTPSSLEVLFPVLNLIKNKSFYSTKTRGERYPLNYDLLRLNEFKLDWKSRWLQRLGFIKRRYPYALCPVMVNAILRKIH